jgi:hypothetical protein
MQDHDKLQVHRHHLSAYMADKAAAWAAFMNCFFEQNAPVQRH